MLREQSPRFQPRHQLTGGGEDDRDSRVSLKRELDNEDVPWGRNLDNVLAGRRNEFRHLIVYRRGTIFGQ